MAIERLSNMVVFWSSFIFAMQNSSFRPFLTNSTKGIKLLMDHQYLRVQMLWLDYYGTNVGSRTAILQERYSQLSVILPVPCKKSYIDFLVKKVLMDGTFKKFTVHLWWVSIRYIGMATQTAGTAVMVKACIIFHKTGMTNTMTL